MTAAAPVSVRPATAEDYAAWRPLWDGYNAFYGRFGATASRAIHTAKAATSSPGKIRSARLVPNEAHCGPRFQLWKFR